MRITPAAPAAFATAATAAFATALAAAAVALAVAAAALALAAAALALATAALALAAAARRVASAAHQSAGGRVSSVRRGGGDGAPHERVGMRGALPRAQPGGARCGQRHVVRKQRPDRERRGGRLPARGQSVWVAPTRRV